MLHAIFSVLLTAIAIALLPHVVPGVRVRSFGTALVVALVYGALNLLLFRLLVLLTLPLLVVTFGLFVVVINAFLLWLTDRLVPGFELRGGAGSTLLASAILSLISGVLHWLFL